MTVTISIPVGLAYGVDETVPTKSYGQDVNDALYHTVHSYHGGVVALAARLGMSPNTLTHKVNVNNTTHHLHPKELVAVMHMSGNAAALHAIAEQLGYTCTPAMPCQAQGSATLAFMRLQMAKAEFVRAVAEPLACMEAQGDAWVTPAELRRAEAAAGDLHTAVDQLTATLRACKRPVPKAD